MGSSWRPGEDWHNPFPTNREEDGMFSRAELFEAGADAMLPFALAEGERRLLEELKAKGKYVDLFEKGWLVLIPEEES